MRPRGTGPVVCRSARELEPVQIALPQVGQQVRGKSGGLLERDGVVEATSGMVAPTHAWGGSGAVSRPPDGSG
jgi:hypothetical protein